MHIVCAMFGRGLGGIEQTLLDFSEALICKGHQVTAVIHPKAEIKEQLEQLSKKLKINIICLGNVGQWDFITMLRLRLLMKKVNADAFITCGNRAISLSKFVDRRQTPVIATTPNYKVKRLLKLDGILYTTNHLKEHIASFGYPEEKLFHVPNMIIVPENHTANTPPYRTPPIIGTMGRFVKKKGMSDFILALKVLKEKGIPFIARIGGRGDEEDKLKQLVLDSDLSDHIQFIGWQEDKTKFFESIDIFCLPSLSEPFGIILLEAFLHQKPVVTTESEGPREIAKHEHDSLKVPVGDIQAIADAIVTLISDESLARELATNAVRTVQENYDIKNISDNIDKALTAITSALPH